MTWPNPAAKWEFPAYTDANREKWQRAIDAALVEGSLVLSEGDEPNAIWIEGSCPRCTHGLRQRIRYNVVRNLDGIVKTNIDCSCVDSHDGRDDSAVGCGWGGPLPVELHPWEGR